MLAIDDAQWADSDSLALLAELTRGPDPVPMLLLATARREPDDPPCAAAASVRGVVHPIALGGLAPDDARALAVHRAAALAEGPVDVDAVVAEAGGHPMFIEELVRHLAAGAGTERVRLDEALRARAARLDPRERRVLQVVAACDRPLPQAAAAEAADLTAAEFGECADALRGARLVRLTGARPTDTVEAYHARVRDAVYGALADDARRALHARVGDALESARAAPEMVAAQLARAGDGGRAAVWFEAAAGAASRALAFGRAAALYRAAIDAGAPPPDERRRLMTAAGEALLLAGRPGEAADVFLEAAALGTPPPQEQLALRRRAAEQYLMGGHLAPGLRATHELLGAYGVRLPATRAGALARLVIADARLGWRPMRWRPRPIADVPARELSLLDLYWSVGAGLSMVDTILGALFVTHSALHALRVGEELRIARAVCGAGMAAAALGNDRRALRLLRAGRRAADSHGSVEARVYADLCAHCRVFLVDNDWHATLRGLAEAEALWRASGRRQGWEVDVIEQFTCWCHGNLGNIGELMARVPGRIRAAQEAGDRFIEITFRLYFAYLHLVDDRPDEALADARDAFESWLPDRDAFGNQAFHHIRSQTFIALYEGAVDERAAAIEPVWRRFGRSVLSRVQLIRQDALAITGLFAAARADAAGRRGDHGAARKHLRHARSAARRLARYRLPLAQLGGHPHAAAIAYVPGDRAAARTALRAGLELAGRLDMQMHAAALRQRLGHLLGGDEGARLVAEGEHAMTSRGIARPDRMTAAFALG